jgi:hypothetical protein
MLWEGFKQRGLKTQLAQGLDGTAASKGASSGCVPLSTQSAGAQCSSTSAQEPDADHKGQTLVGADIGPQDREGQGTNKVGAGPTLQEKPGAASVVQEGKFLDASQWGEDWSWEDKPEFRPGGDQPQGWRWVLARLRALAIEERGPWLRMLTWQDRIIGCVQQVCPEYHSDKELQ